MLILLCSAALATPDDFTEIPAAAEDDRWRASLDRVSRAVVSIRMDRPRSFEGTDRGNSQATGFVVDAEQGLILTNRHVVGAGPVRAQAMFHHNEVVELEPVYRDPIHDFGLFRYDPAALEFETPPSLSLRPADAAVGVQIRVVGNDSGERLSILDGTLARLDRPAPRYGGGYSDFDTFYIQAASSTSGGSSGSPVVDIDGDVVALNAGAKTSAATSYFLPLDRVVRAVERVRRGEPVPRGAMLTRMEVEAYDELRRLGVPDAVEREARAARPGGPGMLVVREVIPEGPADGRLEVGDVLVAIDGALALDFVTLEAALDDRVGATVALRVARDGELIDVTVPVVDLHQAVPSRLLELGGGVLHDVSLHQARRGGVPLRGVYVADAGRSLQAADVPAGAVVIEADGEEIRSLDDLEPIVAAAAHGDVVRLRYFSLGRPQQVGEAALRIDRKWFGVRSCNREDIDISSEGLDVVGERPSWSCADLAGPADAERVRARPLDLPRAPVADRRGEALQPSLVGVRTEVPFPVAGLPGTGYFGGGLVVDAARGLVVADRDTVPIALGDVHVVIGGAFELPARIVALHEAHNLAVIQYDPAALGSVALESASFAPGALAAGDDAWFVGLERDGQIEVREVEVSRVEAFSLPANGAPRFRERNLDVVDLQDRPPSTNGVLVDRKGRVAGLWASFSYNDGQRNRATWRAIPADVVEEAVALAVAALSASPEAPFRTLKWELRTVPLPRALERGLPPAEAERLVAHDPERRTALEVVRVATGDPLGQAVRTGDLLVAVDGRPVTRYRELELALHGKASAVLTVCRGGGLVQAQVAPQPLQPIDVDRVVLWAGVRVHAPDRSAQLEGVEAGKPYVVWLDTGSPAARAGLQPQRTILAVDGRPTPDLDAFLAQIRGAGPSVRLTLRTRQGEREVVTVEPDPTFFGTELLVRGPEGWARQPL
jgi:pro-apoptotic serine protease NMA111